MLRPQHVEQKQPYVDDSCRLLLHFSGMSGNQQFIDSSNTPKVIITYGNTVLSSTHYRFGGVAGYFDGTTDYLTVTLSDLNTIKTVDFWMYKVSAWSGNPVIFSGSSANNGRIQYAATLNFRGVDDSAPCNFGNPTTGIWHHLALTCDGTNATAYVDGVQISQGAETNNVFAGTVLTIGAYYDSTLGTDMYINEFRLWNRVVPIGMLYPQLRPYGYPIGGT